MQITHFKRSAAAVLLAAFSLSSQAVTFSPPAPAFSSLKVFGDSLSDSGNNYLAFGGAVGAVPSSSFYIPSGAPYASGTYSNGNVWVNAFAAAQGLPAAAMPSLAGGSNFAFGGARTYTDGPGMAPSASWQVASFLSGVTTLPSTGLYVIAIGANDVRDTVQGLLTPGNGVNLATQAAAYALAVGNMVDALQAKGAQHIVVWDAPDVGKTPIALASGFSGLGTLVASTFNGALATRLSGEAGVINFDVFGIVNDIVAHPGSYGLSNVTAACGAVINACDVSTALFYDGIHPTAAGQALLATAMINTVAAAVPEPSTWLMLAAGGVALVLRRRRA